MSASVAKVSESFDPRSGEARPASADSTPAEVDRVVRAAADAADAVAAAPPSVRASWLGAIADALEAGRDDLVTVADEETALGRARLGGELAKAAQSLRFYGSVAVDGAWIDATIDHAAGGAPDLRRLNVPLGPVAVFGASNFPFGFGVVGHDTASALAAGCPVVVKAHPAHPRLSEALVTLVAGALAAAGAPGGAFGAVFGMEAGRGLVTHPGIRAVGFTGSQQGGLALWRLAAEREQVIPVFAEMGTVNTVVATPDSAARLAEIAAGFVGSFTLGMGQYCTKPGLLLAPRGAGFPEAVAVALREATPQGWLLTAGIAGRYAEGVQRLVDAGATVVGRSPAAPAGWAASPALLSAPIGAVRAGSPLLEECFGPVAIVAEYDAVDEVFGVLSELPGSLAAGVQSGGDDDPATAPLVSTLVRTCGRVMVDDWPTGVAVTWAQQHGGPWPATTVPSATSVGAAALRRFVRPVAYQGVPEAALPPALRDDNPWGIPQRVDAAGA